MGNRIGLFGGTFDPIHNAHIEIARAAADECRLDEILFVPSGNPPHRRTAAGYPDRLRMVEIACAQDPRFQPSRLEGGETKSYSIDTVERLRATLAPRAEIYFLIGADAFAEIRSWHRWQDLARLVTFAVVSRPGAAYEVPPETHVQSITGIALPLSASEIRARLAAGHQDVDLPPGVLSYIRQYRLYSS